MCKCDHPKLEQTVFINNGNVYLFISEFQIPLLVYLSRIEPVKV